MIRRLDGSLPFVIVAFVGLHLIALHRFGSNNPTGIDTKEPQDTIPFHPYYTVKDLLGLAVFLIVYAWFVFYAPNALLNPDNSIPTNPGVTPAGPFGPLQTRFSGVLLDPGG